MDVLCRPSDGVSVRCPGRGPWHHPAAVVVESFASGNHDEYCRLMDWGLRLCFLLALPSAVALGILAKPLTVALFQYGKFSAFDAAMTQRALVAYSVGLMGPIVVKCWRRASIPVRTSKRR